MVTPDEEQDQYAKDPRTACKYGNQCYQKNPEHLQKYKHPPKKRLHQNGNQQNMAKRPKPNQMNNVGAKKNDTVKAKDTNKITNYLNAWSSTKDKSKDNKGSPAGDAIKNAVPTSTVQVNDISSKQHEASTSTTAQDNSSTNLNVSSTPRNTIPSKEKIEPHQFIQEKFLVKMPPDFFSFWEYCKTVKPDNPSKAFANIGLNLVGPYDVCSGTLLNCKEKSSEEYLTHWRYFYDPPEFQTVIQGPDATGYHIGYFRDDPKELPVFVACNDARLNGELTVMGDNIFAAVCAFIETTLKSCDPFKKMSLTKTLANIKKQAELLQLTLSDKSDSIKVRNGKVLTSTFNKAGLVVPYNRKTQVGYRHLCITNKDLRTLLDRVANSSEQQRAKVLSELQPVLTATSIATDECDFGTGLELGWNILAHGVDSLNGTIEQYLNTAYTLLNRPAFATIISAHMANRKKGTNLSIV